MKISLSKPLLHLLIHASVCFALATLVFYTLFLSPRSESITNDKTIAELEAIIEQQKSFATFLTAINEKKNRLEGYTMLPLGTQHVKLQEMDNLFETLHEQAEKANIVITSITPLQQEQEQEAFSLRCQFKGAFADIRNFFANTAHMPYKNMVESVTLESDEQGLTGVILFHFYLASETTKQ